MKNIIFNYQNLRGEINTTNGQLISLMMKNVEFFHGGGKKFYNGHGWGNSEFVAFPIFGPPKNFKVVVNGVEYSMDQHGLPRHFRNEENKVEIQESEATIIQKYEGQSIQNSKAKSGKDNPGQISFLNYTLQKTFRLTKEGLICELEVTNDSEEEMPYMIGWHPAFRLPGKVEDAVFLYDNGREMTTLKKVLEDSKGPKGAYIEEEVNSATFMDKSTGHSVTVHSNDLSNNVMLWSSGYDAGMFCIEHTSRLPIIFEGDSKAKPHFEDTSEFETLRPGDKKVYSLEVKLELGK